VGSDCSKGSDHGPSRRFNPRSRVGSDLTPMKRAQKSSCFNPRSRVGSDFELCDDKYRERVSIRAPAWGATEDQEEHDKISEFQSALPRGERLPPLVFCSYSFEFQSALPRGERPPNYNSLFCYLERQAER